MNTEQKQRAADLLSAWRATAYALHGDRMAELLQEMVDAPEPKSCGWIRAIDEAMVTHYLGVADIADDYEAAKKKLNTLLILNQDIGGYFSAKAPAPSVPDGWKLAPFEPDDEMVDAACDAGGLFRVDFVRAFKAAMLAAPTPAEPPADVARDAERYRWLRDKCRATGEHWGGRWSLVIEGPCPDGDKSSGSIDKAIDAAIERQGGE